ncbi:carbamoyltransferase HypF [Haemophilus parainfluenzae]|uniref:carbamoyltransferase HypF n=1 Tax=Haemophilus parainfluenzae TaxID=729 RepID=UPI000C9A32FA|nr:carbamoyltransferase HypF [Haemophilus parainfluenzae]PMC56035.1 carbamoyltransferase HypF [Haemophilus parainfluenzae]
MQGIELRIKGKVQGVGFRPFVWLLANQYGLNGDVNNDGQGVLIRFVSPPADALEQFLSDLQNKLPPLAQITDVTQRTIDWPDAATVTSFTIRESENNQMDTQIIPDAATCPHCLADLFDPNNRRYHYPFTNCTHCGPRFTIIKAIPYDRKNTAMSVFPLCPQCEKEYKDPADRRFHAQPNACSVCGPHIWLQDREQTLATHETALKQTALLLQQGYIVAIKGLGGFHLACDANNQKAVNLLRQRKHRPTKPLAIMVPDLQFLQDLAPQETELLTSSAAPIVLLTKHKVPNIADNIAPNLQEIGVMLPSNPLQHLLLRAVNRPLVMTSANANGQPPVLKNEHAVEQLADLADFYLCHNRDILQRADDSLIRVAFDGLETLRRARGYVPDEIPLETQSTKNVLALGSDLKNTFCLLRHNKAVLSQHIGDTANEQVRSQLSENLELFQNIYQFKPDIIAVDAHPGYFSSSIGKQVAEQQQIPTIEVLHHHAHIVSVMAEHNCNEPVIGLALDGIGMGENGQLWGGECLLVDYQHSQYLGGLPAVALPGGDLAAKQPWRNWLAHLHQFVPQWQDVLTQTCIEPNWQILINAIERGLNCPPISSAGRLFDAVAHDLCIAPSIVSWEGEAACHLEALANTSSLATQAQSAVNIPVKMPLIDNKLDLAYFWQSWLNYHAPVEDKAFAFHYALAQGFAELATNQAQKHQCRTIVLSGGVMHNQLLRRLLKEHLSEFHVLSAHKLPMGDGGLSLGQAVIAMHRN